MRKTTLALLAVALIAPADAQVPNTIPANTVVGRLGIGSGPAQAIPFASLTGNLLNAMSGDCTMSVVSVITCTKTNNVAFAPSATTDTTNTANISSGILPVARGGTGLGASGTNGQLLFGVTASAPQYSTLSQDCTVTNAGAITCLSTNNVAFTNYATAARGQLQGIGTNTVASAGNIGEIFSQTILLGSAVSLSTGVAANIATITLTAGEWDISAQPVFDGTSSSTVQGLRASISTTSATENSASPNFWSSSYGGAAIFTTFDVAATIAPIRVSLSGSQQYWLVGRCIFSASTCLGYGSLRATRVH